MLAFTLSDLSFIGTANAQAAGGNPIMSFMPFILILGVMYFLVIRPQNKKAKEHREMVAALAKGDRVIGAGGLFGTVTKLVDDQEIQVEIAEGTTVSMIRSSITQVMAKQTLGKTAAASSTTVTKALKKATPKKSTTKPAKKAPAKKTAKAKTAEK